MTVMITLSEPVAAQLQTQARKQQVTVEELALAILEAAMALPAQMFSTPEQVVAKIQATPPNPSSLRPAVGSLAQALQTSLAAPAPDLAAWDGAWAMVEAEMKATTHANALVEGHR